MAKALTIDEIKVKCQQADITYISHYVDDKKQTKIIAHCQCGEPIEITIRNLGAKIKKGKTCSCKKCGNKKIGQAQKGRKHTQEHIDKARQNRTVKSGEEHHMYGKHHSDEFKQHMREINTGELNPMYGVHRYGEDNPMYGKTYVHTEEAKRKMSENHSDVSRELNPMWKGGITNIKKYIGEYTSSWKQKILEVNDYTCDITKQRGGKLNVHHLKALSTIIEDAHILNDITVKEVVADYTQEELDILLDYVKSQHTLEEGVVLCEEIHRLFHKNYGYGNNTPGQYIEFKQRYLNGEFNNEELDSTTNVA